MATRRNFVNKVCVNSIQRFSVWAWVAALMATLAFVTTPARSEVTYTGTGPGNDAGETNSASVTFSLSVQGTTTNLLVTLTNTALYQPNDPPDILTQYSSHSRAIQR